MHTSNLKVKGDEMSVGYLLFMQLETDTVHCRLVVRKVWGIGGYICPMVYTTAWIV